MCSRLTWLLFNTRHMAGGKASSVWQPTECAWHTGQVCHLCVPSSEPPVVLVAGVCTDSDRLKLVCEYEMPAVTHPIVPLTLVQPGLVCFHVQCPCCCGKAENHCTHTHIHSSQQSMGDLEEHGFLTPTQHIKSSDQQLQLSATFFALNKNVVILQHLSNITTFLWSNIFHTHCAFLPL